MALSFHSSLKLPPLEWRPKISDFMWFFTRRGVEMTLASGWSATNPSRVLVSWSGEKTALRRASGDDAVEADDDKVPLDPFRFDGTTVPFSLIHPLFPPFWLGLVGEGDGPLIVRALSPKISDFMWFLTRRGLGITRASGESAINPSLVLVSWLGVKDPRLDETGEEVVDTDADDGARPWPLTCEATPLDEAAPFSPIQLLWMGVDDCDPELELESESPLNFLWTVALLIFGVLSCIFISKSVVILINVFEWRTILILSH